MNKDVMEKEADDGLKKRCKKTLTRFLSADDDKHSLSVEEFLQDDDKKSPRRSSSPAKHKREHHSQSPRIRDVHNTKNTYVKKEKSPRKDRKTSVGEDTNKDNFSQSQPVIQFQVATDKSQKIHSSSPDVLERKSARRSQSANDAISKGQSSIAVTIAYKKNIYNTPPIGRPRSPSQEVRENNNKAFKIKIIKALSYSGEVLSIKPKNYTTYDLVLSDYKGVEIMDGEAQYYIVYSKLGFDLHRGIDILDSTLSEEKIIETYRHHFPIVAKSRNYSFSVEGFKSVFYTLMYTIYTNTHKYSHCNNETQATPI